MLKHKKQAPTQSVLEPTDVRFGMRGLLATMLVVAVASAALGPYFRNVAPTERGTVAVGWCAALALVLVGVSLHARNRMRLERAAGHRLLSLTPRARLGFPMEPWLTVIGGLLWISFGLYYLAMVALTAQGPRPNTLSLLRVMPCLVSGSFIAMGIVTIWWGRGAQLREHGILRGLHLLRWTHVTAHRWKGSDVYFEGVDQRHRDIRLTVVVNDKDRDAVTHLVARKLSRQLEASSDVALGDEEFSEKKQPLVRIRSQLDVTLRGMVTGFTVYVLLAVFVAARPWGTPPLEFAVGTGIGIFVVALTWIIAAKRTEEPGAPLIRLVAKWDWPSILVSLLVGVGGYFLVQRLVFPSMIAAVGLGIFSGLGAAMFVEMMLRERFDLCENGIMLARWRFLPWSTVRVVRWRRRAKGSLVLRSGWRRLAAAVPAEQCEAVERLLAEKLGLEMAFIGRGTTPDVPGTNLSKLN